MNKVLAFIAIFLSISVLILVLIVYSLSYCVNCKPDPIPIQGEIGECDLENLKVVIDLASLDISCSNNSNCLASFRDRDFILRHTVNDPPIPVTGPNSNACEDDPLYTGITMVLSCTEADEAQCQEPPNCRFCAADARTHGNAGQFQFANYKSGTPDPDEVILIDCEGDGVSPNASNFLTISLFTLDDFNHLAPEGESGSFLFNALKQPGVDPNTIFDQLKAFYLNRWNSDPIFGVDLKDACYDNSNYPLSWKDFFILQNSLCTEDFCTWDGIYSSEGLMNTDAKEEIPDMKALYIDNNCLDLPNGVDHFSFYNCEVNHYVTIIETEVQGKFIRLGYRNCEIVNRHILLAGNSSES
ncbi:MAG: hypothetical protein AAF696_07460 [Bacteroidota bacterium]